MEGSKEHSRTFQIWLGAFSRPGCRLRPSSKTPLLAPSPLSPPPLAYILSLSLTTINLFVRYAWSSTGAKVSRMVFHTLYENYFSH